jgi:Asp/Glu/hydantoin racemase
VGRARPHDGAIPYLKIEKANELQIVALNPNSSTLVTASMERALAPLRLATVHQIICTEIAAAPLGIESDSDVALAAVLVPDFTASCEAEALVVCCFSDPGAAVARKQVGGPLVIGMAEAAYYAAFQHGQRFGVISIGPASILRHRAHITQLGLTQRCVGDCALGMRVDEANDPDFASARVRQIATELRDEDGADVLIIGCAGLAEQRLALQAAVGCVVIDPVQAGVVAAITALDLSYGKEGKSWNA